MASAPLRRPAHAPASPGMPARPLRPVPARPRRGGEPRTGGRAGSRAAFADRLTTVGDLPLLDRLIRGRGWIALIGVALIGLVFLQVSLLKLNTGIGRAVTSAVTLERQNTELRAKVAGMDSGDRLQDAAAKLGMVSPGAGDVHYLRARPQDAARAARSITAPSPVTQQAAAAGTATAGVVGATAATTTATPAPEVAAAVATPAPTTTAAPVAPAPTITTAATSTPPPVALTAPPVAQTPVAGAATTSGGAALPGG